MGERAAQEDAERREARRLLWEAEVRDREAAREADEELEALGVEASELMVSLIVASGYVRHRQGEWRRRF